MAEWKTRGYVPDSDEEEDSQEIEREEASKATNPETHSNDSGEATGGGLVADSGVSVDDLGLWQTQAKVVEVRILRDAKATSGGASQHPDEQSLGPTKGLQIPEGDIKKLQEDHHNHRHTQSHDHLPGTSKRFDSISRTAKVPDDDTGPQPHPAGAGPAQVEADRSSTQIEIPSRNVSPDPLHGSPSSELSSLPDIIGTPEVEAQLRSERAPSFQTAGVNSRQFQIRDSITGDQEAIKRSARSLRQRNPIQLRPYAIEDEKYRQSWKARGLKALRFARAESQAHAEDDTQNADFCASQSSRSSSPRAESSSNHANAALDMDNEFPDMDVLLRRQSDQFVAQGYKRRKLKNAFRPPPAVHPRPCSRQVEFNQDGASNEDDLFDVPLSPPLSGSQTPTTLTVRSGFRMPPALSPRALPTPATSSEPRRPPLLDVLENTSSQAEDIEGIKQRSRSSSQSSQHESAESVHRAKRRIRGVLPASWLRLDLESQAKKPDRHQQLTSLSPKMRSAVKGVARPVMRTMTDSPSRRRSTPSIFELSDDGSISPKENVLSHPSVEHEIVPLDDDDDMDLLSRWGEATENDEVDRMLPPIQRTVRRSRNPKKRQMRMVDFGIQARSTSSPKSKVPRIPNSLPKAISSSHSNLRTPKRRARPPKLSILDAPSMSRDQVLHRTPPFLRIASRTARSRTDKGRHSPSYKYLRLASKKDTDDVTRSLQDWRSGGLVPTANHPASNPTSRRALRPRSANSSGPIVPTPHGDKSSSLQVKARGLKVYRPKARKVQSSLDSLIDRCKRPNSIRAHASRAADLSSHKTSNTTRRLASSFKDLDNARPANLELSQDESNTSSLRAALDRRMSGNLHAANPATIHQTLWDKCPEIPVLTPHPMGLNRDPPTADVNDLNVREGVRSFAEPRKRRKRRPRRLQAVEHCFEEVEHAVENIENRFALAQEHVDPESPLKSGPLLLGLGPFGVKYTSTFDVVPFRVGTCFHQSTFLGSGDFDRSLRLLSHDLDRPRGFAVFSHENRSYRWGAWTEITSVELDDLLHHLKISAHEHASYAPVDQIAVFQRYLISYLSDHLSFLDPIDRQPFVHKGIELIKSFLSAAMSEMPAHNECPSVLHGLGTPHMIANKMYSLVLVNQLCQIANHSVIPQEVRHDLSNLSDACSAVLGNEIEVDFRSLLLLTSKGRSSSSALVIRDNVTAEAFVVAKYILARNERAWKSLLKVLLQPPCGFPPRQAVHVDVLENYWNKIFALQPLLEIDSQGVLVPGRRFKMLPEDWTCVRSLMTPVLELYMSNAAEQAPSLNPYCRAIFTRCLYLLKAWGWRRCEIIIGTLFDFFARSSLNHLRNEESHGSPAFLEDLSDSLDLQAEPEDRCFHLLLKIIGTGVRFLRLTSAEKKIRGLVWRLMPNHGRSHPKDETIHQQDLDALRNHHDLLCTLYWASPPGLRPRLSVLRNLVPFENSHKEVCHINIRAWSNLVRYQISTDEPLSGLVPFVEWHEDLVQQILRQHSLARTEAEEQVKSVQHAQGLLVSQQLLESTITRNQRQVEAVLSDALTSLNRAINSARTTAAATLLLSRSVTAAFVIYDSTRSQTVSPVLESLDIVLSYVQKCHALNEVRITQDDNDDSQDYGDWPIGGEDSNEITNQNPENEALEEIQQPLHQLLSNCFGADTPPPDNLLSQLVRVWTAVGQERVKQGRRSWADYIGSYGNETWSSLRGTDQTRKYTAWYLTMLLETDSAIFNQNRGFFLRFWIGSLMERESLLKFQHELTSALLNADSGDPLLENLPFWRSRSTLTYNLTAREFSERRVSLISCVLSNMRASIDDYQQRSRTEIAGLKQEYKDLLRSMMSTMKQNYQELGKGSVVKGAYVDFVHKIVEFLQQYTSAICPIDRYFTDNASFPLPATDPTYVVGQLKNYGLRLQDARAGKELAVFLQSVSERAAIDGQQTYLVGQLYAAMADTSESSSQRPTIRGLIIGTIIPAYMESAFTTACGWILVSPFLEAVCRIFDELLLGLDGCNIAIIQSAGFVIETFLDTIGAAVKPILDQPRLLQRAPTVSILQLAYACITALIPTLDYVLQLDTSLPHAIGSVNFFTSLSIYINQNFSDPIALSQLAVQNLNPDKPHDAFPEIRRFATDGLSQTLDRNWTSVDGHYFATVGASKREVMVDVGLLEEEMEGLKSEVQAFWTCLARMPGLGGEVDWRMDERMVGMMTDMEDCVI